MSQRLTNQRLMVQPRLVGSILILGMIATATRGDDPSPESGVSKGETPVVLRVSKELFEELTRDVIEMSVPIDRTLDGTKLTGQASGTGRTSILMYETDQRAEVIISITGNGSASMRADVGPANVHVSSRARFTTQKRIRLDGDTYRDDPATTETRNCTTVDRICPKRRGLVGCLVRRVGRRMADKATPDLNAEAEKATREVLTNKFDESAKDLVVELNRTTELDELVDKYFPETQSWTTRSVSRPTFLVAGMGPPSTEIPEFLVSKDNEPRAFSELWLRTTPGQAALLQLVADMDSAYDLLRDDLPEEDSDELLDDVKLSRRGDWTVIEMGLPKPSSEPAGGDSTNSSQGK